MIDHCHTGENMTRTALIALLTLGVLGTTAQAETVFTPEDILEWDNKSFQGETRYTLTEVEGKPAIHAVCDDSTASGFFLEEPIDLEETPIMEWEWRLEEPFSNIDETEKTGDDYALRIYAVDRHRLLRWRTRALNYVWASEQPQGSDWPNAYQPVAQMIAVQSGAPETDSKWRTERRNLREDFKHYHDRELDQVDAIAIMTDCDDTQQSVESWYGEIRFLAE